LTSTGAFKAWLTRRIEDPERFGLPTLSQIMHHGGFKKTEAQKILKSVTKKIPVAHRPGNIKIKLIEVKDQRVIKKKLELIQTLN